MSVTLRWKKYANGTLSAYLDIYDKGSRKKEFIDIKIHKNCKDRKERKAKAQAIAARIHNEILDRRHNLISDDKQSYCLLKYFQLQIDRLGGLPSTKKKKWALMKFIDYLRSVQGASVETEFVQERASNKAGVMHVERVRLDGTKTVLPFKNLSDQSLLFKDYKRWLLNDSGLSGATPYDYWAKLKWCINRAREENYLFKNPLHGIKFEQPDNATLIKEIVTLDEIQTLARTPCSNHTVKMAFLFSCFTGMGAKELRTLSWTNVRNGVIHTKRGKNNNVIRNKLPKSALKILDEMPKRNEFIFNDLPTTSNGINKVLKVWVRNAGIKKHITFYCGRHSFGVLSLKATNNQFITAKLLGHRSTKHTEKYLNHIEDMKDEAMDKLGEIEL